MYSLPAFEETRPDVIKSLIKAHPLATLVYARDGLDVEHVPMQVQLPTGSSSVQDDDVPMVLEGHIARMNPLWQALGQDLGHGRGYETEQDGNGVPLGEQVVAVFQGPQGYITPSWYESKREHGRVVPTWNYAVVHAHGTLRLIDDVDWLRRQVSRLTDSHETGRDDVWAVTDAPARFTDMQLKAIVGVEIEVTRVVGKWKMSQNRPQADQSGVIDGLKADAQNALAAAVSGATGKQG